MGPWFDEYMMHMAPEEALRVCLRQAGEKYAAHVLQCADAMLTADACTPANARALFFAWEQTGDDRYAQAIRRMMEAMEAQPVLDGAALAFCMAYEMKLNRMERVGQTAAMFRRAQQRMAGCPLEEKAGFLQAVTDAVEVCTEQLYEHWRALVDIYRAVLAEVLPQLAEAAPNTLARLLWALFSGMEMGLIDPERYLPVAGKYLAVLRQKGEATAADVLEEVFGVR